MTGSHAKLVPITREFLRSFYEKFPLEPVPVDVHDHTANVEVLAAAVGRAGSSNVAEQVGFPTPTRIDDCFWRSRMICEELALSFQRLSAVAASKAATWPGVEAACERCGKTLLAAERTVLAVQEMNTASVKKQLQQFMPQDFRGALLERTRVAKEAHFKKQVDDMMKKGGTIRQKYDLFLQQQWQRRISLAQLGEASGAYRLLVKYLAGIPQVLLDFAKEINAKVGPMEEQRIIYGPDLYLVTTLGIRLNVCLALLAEAACGPAPTPAAEQALAGGQMLAVVEPAVHFYVHHMLRVISFIGDVFQVSPFFIGQDDGGGSEVGEGGERGHSASANGSATGSHGGQGQHGGGWGRVSSTSSVTPAAAAAAAAAALMMRSSMNSTGGGGGGHQHSGAAGGLALETMPKDIRPRPQPVNVRGTSGDGYGAGVGGSSPGVSGGLLQFGGRSLRKDSHCSYASAEEVQLWHGASSGSNYLDDDQKLPGPGVILEEASSYEDGSSTRSGPGTGAAGEQEQRGLDSGRFALVGTPFGHLRPQQQPRPGQGQGAAGASTPATS